MPSPGVFKVGPFHVSISAFHFPLGEAARKCATVCPSLAQALMPEGQGKVVVPGLLGRLVSSSTSSMCCAMAEQETAQIAD